MNTNKSNTNKSKTLIAAEIAASIAIVAIFAYMLSGPTPLPAQTPPLGLQAGHAQVYMGIRPIWLETVSQMAAAVQLAVPRDPSMPTWRGATVFHWSAWFNAPKTGTYTFSEAITGGGKTVADVRVRVDGKRVVANAAVGCRPWSMQPACKAPSRAATGEVDLRKGWHEIAIDSTAYGRGGVATLAIRAPGAPAAVPLVPYWPKK